MAIRNRIFGTLILLILMVMSSPCSEYGSEKYSIEKQLINEIRQHPEYQIDDIYKFIHQASFGSEHAVKDTAHLRKWMEEEIAGLDLSINEPLVQPLSPDGKLVRINLRPYIQNEYDIEKLLTAFIRTANEYKGPIQSIKTYWKCALKIADRKKLGLKKAEMKKYFSEMEKKNFPAVHHSAVYEKKYRPAYRVVNIEYLPFLKTHLDSY